MIELPMIFIAGILGTSHCLGMCGPFALTIGSAAPAGPAALTRQAAYTAGRVFTLWNSLAPARLFGARLVHALPTIVNVPATLAVVAGVLLIYNGLVATGLFSKRAVGGMTAPCLAGGFLRGFLRQPQISSVFLAGVFTGFLPCGLLYGMLALAMSSHSVVLGGATLIVFGLGTAPAMMLAGVSGRLMGLAMHRRLYVPRPGVSCLQVLFRSPAVCRSFRLAVSRQMAAQCASRKSRSRIADVTHDDQFLTGFFLADCVRHAAAAAVIVRFVFPPRIRARGWYLWGLNYDQWATVQFAILAILAPGNLDSCDAALELGLRRHCYAIDAR